MSVVEYTKHTQLLIHTYCNDTLHSDIKCACMITCSRIIIVGACMESIWNLLDKPQSKDDADDDSSIKFPCSMHFNVGTITANTIIIIKKQ